MKPLPPFHLWLGWDPRELRAWNVAAMSFRSRALIEPIIHRLNLPQLRAQGLYTRPTREEPTGGYFDEISEAPMATGHAIARFLVPALMDYQGWALFTDGDVLCRADIGQLFALADPEKAVQVVPHQYAPLSTVKMDGQIQTFYARKNWSSVMLLHCAHPANRALTVDLVNTVPGRDLHRFCWLDDALIGSLPVRWNLLVGHSPYDDQAALVHFTEGVPDMPGYEHCDYADERYALTRSCGYRLPRPAKPEAAA
jgi:hypothetical protein